MHKITSPAGHIFRSIALRQRVTAMVCAISLLLAACGAGSEEKWQEQYDLGERYFNEGDYEQAIVSFRRTQHIGSFGLLLRRC